MRQGLLTRARGILHRRTRILEKEIPLGEAPNQSKSSKCLGQGLDKAQSGNPCFWGSPVMQASGIVRM